MKLLSNTTLFSYESINDIEKKIWKMGVDIPLHGSELLALDWSEIENSGAKFRGNFSRRIYVTLRNHEKSKENLNNLKDFADGFGQLIYLKEKMAVANTPLCSFEKCTVGNKELSWSFSDGHLYFDYVGRAGKPMRFDFSVLSEQGPEKISIYPIENSSKSNNFKLELFFNNCK